MEIENAKNWLKNIVIAILGFIILGLFIKSCGKDKEINNLKLDMVEYDQRFMQRIKADSTREFQQKQLIASKDVAIKMLGDEAKHYRNIKAVVKTKIEIIHDTITAAYTDIIQNDTCITVGTKFYEASKYDTISGTVLSTGVQIIRSPYSVGEMTTVIADRREGFLKLKHTPVVDISFSNPNVRVVSMGNVVVEQRKPKRLIWLVTGLGLGLIGGALIH
jgi:LPS O-antigen subunit length determinant protein (WzzB/FepE family)